MALGVLVIGETPHLCAAQRHRPTQPHCDDQSHAITTVARLSFPRNSTSHRALTSVRGAGSTRRHDKWRPLPALGADAVTPSDLLAAAEVPFLVVSLNSRDGTHPNSGIGAPRRATDPGMLPRPGRTAIRWWS